MSIVFLFYSMGCNLSYLPVVKPSQNYLVQLLLASIAFGLLCSATVTPVGPHFAWPYALRGGFYFRRKVEGGQEAEVHLEIGFCHFGDLILGNT